MERVQINLRLDEADVKILEDFQFGNRIPSRTEAMRRILRLHARRTSVTPFDWLNRTDAKDDLLKALKDIADLGTCGDRGRFGKAIRLAVAAVARAEGGA